jgi:hypothetical protein
LFEDGDRYRVEGMRESKVFISPNSADQTILPFGKFRKVATIPQDVEKAFIEASKQLVVIGEKPIFLGIQFATRKGAAEFTIQGARLKLLKHNPPFGLFLIEVVAGNILVLSKKDSLKQYGPGEQVQLENGLKIQIGDHEPFEFMLPREIMEGEVLIVGEDVDRGDGTEWN